MSLDDAKIERMLYNPQRIAQRLNKKDYQSKKDKEYEPDTPLENLKDVLSHYRRLAEVEVPATIGSTDSSGFLILAGAPAMLLGFLIGLSVFRCFLQPKAPPS